LDLARPKENENNTMFTPKERGLLDELLNLGFTDSFRIFKKSVGYYSWWSYGFNARERNLGWRIDYAFISNSLASRVKDCSTHPEVSGSDHCPVVLEI
jgi:exodeoxyribonuclease-3